MNFRVPWQCLYAYVFEISSEQETYGHHIVRFPFAVQIGLPKDPDQTPDGYPPDIGNLTTQGDTPNEAICNMVKALTLLDYRGEIIFFAASEGPQDVQVGTVDFEPEKPKVRMQWAEISDTYGFSPVDHFIE